MAQHRVGSERKPPWAATEASLIQNGIKSALREAYKRVVASTPRREVPNAGIKPKRKRLNISKRLNKN